MYHIVIEPGGDFYQDMIDHKDFFDLSNYPPTHPYYEPALARNKAVLGKMKDEAGGHAISVFIGLRPKMYSYQYVKLHEDGTSETVDKHRAKGIQRAAAAKLTHAEYKAQLNLPTENFVVNRRLGSRLHKIYGIEVNCSVPFTHMLCFCRYIH